MYSFVLFIVLDIRSFWCYWIENVDYKAPAPFSVYSHIWILFDVVVDFFVVEMNNIVNGIYNKGIKRRCNANRRFALHTKHTLCRRLLNGNGRMNGAHSWSEGKKIQTKIDNRMMQWICARVRKGLSKLKKNIRYLCVTCKRAHSFRRLFILPSLPQLSTVRLRKRQWIYRTIFFFILSIDTQCRHSLCRWSELKFFYYILMGLNACVHSFKISRSKLFNGNQLTPQQVFCLHVVRFINSQFLFTWHSDLLKLTQDFYNQKWRDSNLWAKKT